MEAHLSLAEAHERGEMGLEVDETKTIEWYAKAASGGNTEALCRLAHIRRFGKYGTTPDVGSALELYRRAAVSGGACAKDRTVGKSKNQYCKICSSDSYVKDGLCISGRSALQEGRNSCKPNAQLALEVYRRDFLSEDRRWSGEAQKELGYAYLDGFLGLSRDYGKASTWFEKAAQCGQEQALFWLAECYDFGCYGYTKDNEKAIELYLKAARPYNDHASGFDPYTPTTTAGNAAAAYAALRLGDKGVICLDDREQGSFRYCQGGYDAFKWYELAALPSSPRDGHWRGRAAYGGNRNAWLRLAQSYEQAGTLDAPCDDKTPPSVGTDIRSAQGIVPLIELPSRAEQYFFRNHPYHAKSTTTEIIEMRARRCKMNKGRAYYQMAATDSEEAMRALPLELGLSHSRPSLPNFWSEGPKRQRVSFNVNLEHTHRRRSPHTHCSRRCIAYGPSQLPSARAAPDPGQPAPHLPLSSTSATRTCSTPSSSSTRMSSCTLTDLRARSFRTHERSSSTVTNPSMSASICSMRSATLT